MMYARLLRLRPVAAAGAAAVSLHYAQGPPAQSALWFGGDSYHLRYFNARGAVETSRLLLALAGKEFTDERWPMDFSKPRDQMSPEMVEARSKGLLKANLDRAPVLVVNGTSEIGQSKSIERYLAKRLGFMGSSEIEAAQIDCFSEHIRDLKDKYNKAKATLGAEDKKVALEQFFSEAMPEFLGKMEASVAGSGKGVPLIGKSLSLADVSLFVLVTEYFDHREPILNAMKACPRLSASVEAVGAHPTIRKYLGERPATLV